MARKKKYNFDRIQKIITAPELALLQDLIIFQETDGSYQLFNKYVIQKMALSEYKVTVSTSDAACIFTSLKNATAWCIFDKRNKFYETRRILELDTKLVGIEVDILVHLSLFKKAKTSDDQLIYVAKLREDRIRKKMMTEELESYTADSKEWQSRRFDLKAA